MAKTKTKPKEREEEEDLRRPTPVARDGVYVMMLAATLLAIIISCVLLYLDNDEYGGKTPPKEAAPAVQPLGTGPAPKGSDAPVTTPAP